MKKKGIQILIATIVVGLMFAPISLQIDGSNISVIKQEASAARKPAARTWKIDKKTYKKLSYGSFRNGPSGKGPRTISFTTQKGYNRSVSSTVTGSFPVGTGTLSLAFGQTIGVSTSKGTSYSISVPKNKRRMILYRPRYKVYQVRQRQYLVVGGKITNTLAGSSPVAFATVQIFDGWDYSWKEM